MNSSERPSASNSEREPTREFSKEIEIDGLPFIFSGSVTEDTRRVRLSLSIPDWQTETRGMDQGNTHVDSLLETGEIGRINGTKGLEKDTDIYLSRIRSFADQLPEQSRYRGSHVGRFLMNNFLALCDMKNWRVSAFAYTDGRLSDDDVRAWLKRKGFENGVRQPQAPDSSEPITVILDSELREEE